jgi:hypothetical protein
MVCGVMHCRMLIRASRMPLLAALATAKGMVHVWVYFLFASADVVVAVIYNWEA